MKNILIVGAFIIAVLMVVLFVMDTKKGAEPKSENTNLKESRNETVGVKDLDVKIDGTGGEVNVPSTPDSNGEVSERADTSRIAPGEVPPVVPLGKLKVANFTGKLEKVDVGCFADGECFVEVDGKHITAIMGWSQAVVGSVQGVEGFGDLESHIGEEVEVYAQDNSDGTYTLYGNAGFYIKL